MAEFTLKERKPLTDEQVASLRDDASDPFKDRNNKEDNIILLTLFGAIVCAVASVAISRSTDI